MSIFRVAEEDCPLLEILEAIRPHLQLTFDSILAHINTIFVLKTRPGVMSLSEQFLRLKVSIRRVESMFFFVEF